MLLTPMDVLSAFPVRKTKKQKAAFREAAQSYLTGLGYSTQVEKGALGSRNLVIGCPDQARYLVTAHYDTPARMFAPNFITPTNFPVYLLYQLVLTAVIFGTGGILGWLAGRILNNSLAGAYIGVVVCWLLLILLMAGPANPRNANDNTSGVVTVLETAKALPEQLRDQVCFVLFDLEELGMIGSSSYRKAHKEQTKNQIVLNLDCVGDGDELVIFPTKKLKKQEDVMERLRSCTGSRGDKNLILHEKGFAFYPSDQSQFPLGCGIAAFHKNRWLGLWLARIHTAKDTVLEEENVTILRDLILTLISAR